MPRAYRCTTCAYRGRRTADGRCPSCLTPLDATLPPLSRRAVLVLTALRLGFVLRHDPTRRHPLGPYWLTVPPGAQSGRLGDADDNQLRRLGLRQATVHTATVSALERRGWLRRRLHPKSPIVTLLLRDPETRSAKAGASDGGLPGEREVRSA